MLFFFVINIHLYTSSTKSSKRLATIERLRYSRLSRSDGYYSAVALHLLPGLYHWEVESLHIQVKAPIEIFLSMIPHRLKGDGAGQMHENVNFGKSFDGEIDHHLHICDARGVCLYWDRLASLLFYGSDYFVGFVLSMKVRDYNLDSLFSQQVGCLFPHTT